jgi:small subunit ribosomal protein S1
MWDLLNRGEYDFVPAKAGDMRQGKIVRVEANRITVDIGGKKEGVITPEELEKVSPEVRERLVVGAEIPVFVVRNETPDEEATLSLTQAKSFEDWVRVENLFNTGEVFEGQISTYNKGGLIVPFGKLRGFIPASQVVSRPPEEAALPAPAPKAETPRPTKEASKKEPPAKKDEELSPDLAWLQKMVGMKLRLKVIEVDPRRRRLIFSERQAMKQWRKSQRERLLEESKDGDILTGRISNLTPFGAFVDLGGVDGLIHVSELSWQRVRHPSDVVKVGQEVKVMVLRVERDKGRVALSMKRTQVDPWLTIEERYQRGQSVEGTVTNMTDFGAFVQLEAGVEGLVHVSEMRGLSGSAKPKVGDKLSLRVLNVDVARQRISLEIKAAQTEKAHG